LREDKKKSTCLHAQFLILFKVLLLSSVPGYTAAGCGALRQATYILSNHRHGRLEDRSSISTQFTRWWSALVSPPILVYRRDGGSH